MPFDEKQYTSSGNHTHANIIADPDYATITANQINWTTDPTRTFQDVDNVIRKAAPQLGDIKFEDYGERELRFLKARLDLWIAQHFAPKPPKFNSIEEADAWMEEHYGQ